MNIITETFVYEFNNYRDCLKYIESRCHNIKKSLRLISKEKEHLKVRCPFSGEYLVVNGTFQEIDWVHEQLQIHDMYRKD